jgi:hypothetical protein
MTATVMMQNEVRDIVKGYYHAWSSGNLEVARFFLADDLDFQGSIDRFHTADAFIATLGAFHRKLSCTRLLKEFYAPNGAMLLYDCVTDSPAGTIRTAEYFGVSSGKIFEIRLVFDATLLRQSMQR